MAPIYPLPDVQPGDPRHSSADDDLSHHTILHRKVNDWIDVVSDYGADATGAVDSTAVIQVAVYDATILGGGVVVIPRGVSWDPSALLIPVPSGGSANTFTTIYDYSSPTGHTRIWQTTPDNSFTLVGDNPVVTPGFSGNGNAPYLILANTQANLFEPYSPGIAAQVQGIDTISAHALSDPYNIWSMTFGNWGNRPFTGTVTATTTLTTATDQFIATDVGRRIQIGAATLTISMVISSKIVTFAPAVANAVYAVKFDHSLDFVIYAWQPNAVFAGTARTAPTSPGTQIARLVWGQNGVAIWNPDSDFPEGYDPLAAYATGNFFHVICSTGAKTTAKILIAASGANGSAGFELWTSAATTAKKFRFQLDDAVNTFVIANTANLAILSLTQNGDTVIGTTNQATSVDPGAADLQSLGLVSRWLLVNAMTLRTEHVAGATPTGGASGDIKVGDGKIWVNDAGTWKSAPIA